MSKLYKKYKIEKTDGTLIDPEAQYFVLRIDTDAEARAAVLYYADLIDDWELADQLRRLVYFYSQSKGEK